MTTTTEGTAKPKSRLLVTYKTTQTYHTTSVLIALPFLVEAQTSIPRPRTVGIARHHRYCCSRRRTNLPDLPRSRLLVSSSSCGCRSLLLFRCLRLRVPIALGASRIYRSNGPSSQEEAKTMGAVERRRTRRCSSSMHRRRMPLATVIG